MWRTDRGDRVLVGQEAEVFRKGLASLVDWVQSEPEYRLDVPVFDRLSMPEKMAVLEQVGRALLIEQVPCPELTAVNEGAIAAVYWQLVVDVEAEIDAGRSEVRKLIRNACTEWGLIDVRPELRSRDSYDWEQAVDELMFRILWDCDWDAEYTKPDDLPEDAAVFRECMGIHPDYYTAVAPDPNPIQLEEIRRSLRLLCEGVKG